MRFSLFPGGREDVRFMAIEMEGVMMRKGSVLMLGLVAVSMSACLPVLVGGLVYKSSKPADQKQEFMSQLQRTNADRESRGLRPLDWCSEAYRFDRGWAWENTNCRARIERYERGDATALDLSEQH